MIKNNSKFDRSLEIVFISFIPQLLVSIIGILLIPLLSFMKYSGIIQTWIVLPLSFVIIPYFFLKSKNKDIVFQDIGIKKLRFIDIVTILIALIICVVYYVYFNTREINVVLYMIQILPVAISEEIWARGMLFYMLRKLSIKPIYILIITSLVFTFITHANRPFLDNLLYRFPGAIIMGIIYFKTKKIEYPIVVHFVNNFIGGL